MTASLLPRAGLTALVLLLAFRPAAADPQPGDVYREYVWKPEGQGLRGRFQRVTSPDAKAERAKRFLPNPVNRIEVTDLGQAVRAEVQVELLQCHYGTVGQAFRLNGGAWIPLPPSEHIPGDAGGAEGGPHHWPSMRYPAAPVPLAQLKPGVNTLEFTCAPGFGLGERWPQSLVNGAILRVYYAPTKPHATGTVALAPAGDPSVIGTDLVFTPANPAAAIRRVDFIGRYRGFDWRGDGVYYRFHYNFRRGELRHHLATAAQAPWRATWNTRWLPVQDQPVAVTARIVDTSGVCYLTPALEGADVVHPRSTRVELFTPKAISPRWTSRAGRRHSCIITLPDDLSDLREARVQLATWNGHGAGAIGVNDVVITRNVGLNHDLSYDTLTVPVSALRPGANEFFTSSDDREHGIEVQWPAFVLLARFGELRVPRERGEDPE